MLALALLATAVPVRIHVDAQLFPNAAHNVACLSGRLPCSRPNIEKFWHDDMHWTPADQTALDRWNETIKAVAARQASPRESPFLPNFAGWYPELVVVQKLVAAGLASRSEADFRRRAAGLALPEEVALLSASLGHFAVRLVPWWEQTGRAYSEERRGTIEAQLKKLRGDRLADRIAAFFEAELPTRDFYLHLIPRGDRASKDAMATFSRNHMVVELTDSMKPPETASIILHEMTHALYEMAPPGKQRQLIRDFAASAEPTAQALYAILNEGLATAVQLDVDKRAGIVDDDPYHHPFIPRIGQANAAPLREAMDRGSTLFAGYLPSYLTASLAALGREAASPKFTLMSGIVADFGDLKSASAAFRENFAMLSSTDFGDRARYPDLNIAFLLPYDKLSVAARDWPAVEDYAKTHRGFVFAGSRGKLGKAYILAGRDEATVLELIRKLAAIREAVSDGLVLTVE